MTDINKLLNEADPLAREQGLSSSQARSMRQTIIAGAPLESADAL
jgi:hypothetical protein